MNELHNYSIDKERAIKQMFDMNKRATEKHLFSKNHNTRFNHTSSFFNLNIDNDTLTILALMLILYNESSDMMLIFALAYILF